MIHFIGIYSSQIYPDFPPHPAALRVSQHHPQTVRPLDGHREPVHHLHHLVFEPSSVARLIRPDETGERVDARREKHRSIF